MSRSGTRRGIGAVEVICGVLVVGLVILYLLMAMPRGREAARRASCQRNLMQIGMALNLYHQAAGQLPTARIGGEGPLTAMLDELGQADFTTLTDRKVAPPKVKGFQATQRVVRGFVCASDPNATDGHNLAPISYRATTGDTTDGLNGPFALGRRVTIEEVEAADGLSYTAGFSERLVGGSQNAAVDLAAYASVAGPVDRGGSPAPNPASIRLDAGSSWLKADWQSTLYNHASVPGATPSCVAADGLTALMGTSSGHAEGVNVMMLDGSVKTYRTSVSPGVWQALSTIGTPTP